MCGRYWLWSLVVMLLMGCLGGGTIQFTLRIEVMGEGTVVPSVGEHKIDLDTMVGLTATPEEGWEFVRWEGDVADKNSATTEVLLDDNQTVTAVFEQTAEPEPGDPGEQASHTVDGVGFYMRLAPASTFPTGLDDSGSATVDTAFWIAETQVTYELWYTVRQWALSDGYIFANAGLEGSHGTDGQAPTSKRNEPVTWFSWRDSIVWCNALSEMLGYQPVYTYQGSVIRDSTDGTACDNAVQENANGFRLPTSNEWELAARYNGSDSSHGSIWTPGSFASGATADYTDALATEEVAWYLENSGGSTKDVGLKRANGLGVYDMSGNAFEWTFTKIESERVFRGGGWNSPAVILQVGRVDSGGSAFVYNLGFRLARTQF